MKFLIEFTMTLVWWSFLIIKIWGTAFAAWSWWWVLLPIVPWLWRLLNAGGLL